MRASARLTRPVFLRRRDSRLCYIQDGYYMSGQQRCIAETIVPSLIKTMLHSRLCALARRDFLCRNTRELQKQNEGRTDCRPDFVRMRWGCVTLKNVLRRRYIYVCEFDTRDECKVLLIV